MTTTIAALASGNPPVDADFFILDRTTGTPTTYQVTFAQIKAVLGIGANTVASPAFFLPGDPNTGAYSVGADDYGISTGGTLRFDVSTTAITSTLPIVLPAGAVGTPSLTFTGDLDNGLYYIGTNNWATSVGGVVQLNFTASTCTLPAAGYTFASGTANTILTLKSAVSSGDSSVGIKFQNVFSFTGGAGVSQAHVSQTATVNQTSTAAFTALDIAITETAVGSGAQYLINAKAGASGTTQVFAVTNAGRTYAGLGTAALPSQSFVGRTDDGFYSNAGGSIAVSTAGVARMVFLSTGIEFLTTGQKIFVNAANAVAVLGGAFTTSANGPWQVLNGSAFTASTAVQQMAFRIFAGVNQTSTASFASIYVNQSLSSDGVTGTPVFGSGGGWLMDLNSAATRKFSVRDNGGIGVAHVSPAALAAGNTDDYAGIGTYGVARMTSDGAGSVLRGIAAPLDARQLTIVHIAGLTLTINNQDAGSAAANRIQTSTGAAVVLGVNDTMTLWYDLTSAFWRQVTTAA